MQKFNGRKFWRIKYNSSKFYSSKCAVIQFFKNFLLKFCAMQYSHSIATVLQKILYKSTRYMFIQWNVCNANQLLTYSHFQMSMLTGSTVQVYYDSYIKVFGTPLLHFNIYVHTIQFNSERYTKSWLAYHTPVAININFISNVTR